MKEVYGNIWDYEKSPNVCICITTNGFVKKNGRCVMGRGNALEAAQKFPTIQADLGRLILNNGNKFQLIFGNIYAFPTKHNWYEIADIDLIIKSAKELALLASENPNTIYLLPRPGCSNGKLQWSEVKLAICNILPDNVAAITNEKE